MDLGLGGLRALVTGASRGIGFEIAKTLAKEGADIAICARSQEGVDDAVKALSTYGVRTMGRALDVRKAGAVERFVNDSTDAFSGIDIVISNVSTRIQRGADTAEWWRETFETDLLQHVRLFEAALPALKESDHGSAVFIASIASILTQLPPEELAYGGMKAALVNYVGQMGVRHAGDDVRVNAISPGPIYFEGGFWHMVEQKVPDLYQAATRISAMGRLGTPEEVAKPTVFLASPAAGYMTGANIRIDGAAVRAANF